jgi:hypothetical protein
MTHQEQHVACPKCGFSCGAEPKFRSGGTTSKTLSPEVWFCHAKQDWQRRCVNDHGDFGYYPTVMTAGFSSWICSVVR